MYTQELHTILFSYHNKSHELNQTTLHHHSSTDHQSFCFSCASKFILDNSNISNNNSSPTHHKLKKRNVCQLMFSKLQQQLQPQQQHVLYSNRNDDDEEEQNSMRRIPVAIGELLFDTTFHFLHQIQSELPQQQPQNFNNNTKNTKTNSNSNSNSNSINHQILQCLISCQQLYLSTNFLPLQQQQQQYEHCFYQEMNHHVQSIVSLFSSSTFPITKNRIQKNQSVDSCLMEQWWWWWFVQIVGTWFQQVPSLMTRCIEMTIDTTTCDIYQHSSSSSNSSTSSSWSQLLNLLIHCLFSYTTFDASSMNQLKLMVDQKQEIKSQIVYVLSRVIDNCSKMMEGTTLMEHLLFSLPQQHELIRLNNLNRKNSQLLNVLILELQESENIDYQRNILAFLLKTFQKLEQSLLLETCCDFKLLFNAIVTVLLSNDEEIQIVAVQLISLLMDHENSTSLTQVIVNSDVPDFLFEAMKTESFLLLSSILVTLWKMVRNRSQCSEQSFQVFLSGFLHYGMNSIETMVVSMKGRQGQIVFSELQALTIGESVTGLFAEVVTVLNNYGEKEEYASILGQRALVNLSDIVTKICCKNNEVMLGSMITCRNVLRIVAHMIELDQVSELISEAILHTCEVSMEDVLDCVWEDNNHNMEAILEMIHVATIMCCRKDESNLKMVTTFVNEKLWPNIIQLNTSIQESVLKLYLKMYNNDSLRDQIPLQCLISSLMNIHCRCASDSIRYVVCDLIQSIINHQCPTHPGYFLSEIQAYNWETGFVCGMFHNGTSHYKQKELVIILKYIAALNCDFVLLKQWTFSLECITRHSEQYSIHFLPYLYSLITVNNETQLGSWLCMSLIEVINGQELNLNEFLTSDHWIQIFRWIFTLNDVRETFQLFEACLSSEWGSSIISQLADVPQLPVLVHNSLERNGTQLVVPFILQCSQDSQFCRELVGQCSPSFSVFSIMSRRLTLKKVERKELLQIIQCCTLLTMYCDPSRLETFQLTKIAFRELSSPSIPTDELVVLLNFLNVGIFVSNLNQQLQNQISLLAMNEETYGKTIKNIMQRFIKPSQPSDVQIGVLQLVCQLAELDSNCSLELKEFTKDLMNMIHSESPYVASLSMRILSCILKVNNFTDEDLILLELLESMQYLIMMGPEYVRRLALQLFKDLSNIERIQPFVMHPCWNQLVLQTLISESKVREKVDSTTIQFVDFLQRNMYDKGNNWLKPSRMLCDEKLCAMLETQLEREIVNQNQDHAQMLFDILSREEVLKAEPLAQYQQVLLAWKEQQTQSEHDLQLFPQQRQDQSIHTNILSLKSTGNKVVHIILPLISISS